MAVAERVDPGRLDVIAFGSIYLEVVFGNLLALPARGEEIFTDQFAFSCGGAISIASAASGVGARAGLATVLGDDLGARVAAAHCARVGVDTSACRRVEGPTSGVTVVLNFDGDRSFISHMPRRDEAMPDATWWAGVARARQPKWIYLYASGPALGVIAEARRAGCAVAVDTELGTIGRSPEVVLECAAAADLFLPTRRELARLTGTEDIAHAVAALDAPGATIIVKEGPNGATVARAGQLEHSSAGLRDVRVRDRTGAGAAFAGALLGSLALGRDVMAAVEAANTAGSEAVARLGAIGPVGLVGEAEMRA
jgi:sugar/nucleoside kinase (ribokinase family)